MLGSMAAELVIEARALRKRYRSTVALDGIDLEMARGEVLSLLGPNGAGKTTTVEILEGYRRHDGGEALVLGQDPSGRACPGGHAEVSCCKPARTLPT